jgi:L-threonylcarbamoyladenylate synthase
MRSDSTPTVAPEIEILALDQAVSILKMGGLVAFPTETVYGLGADAENVEALDRLYTVKGRPKGHPVIVHIADAAQLAQWAVDIPEQAHQLAQAFWPGPLTLILKRNSRVPDAVTGGQDTVGIRVPDHPIMLALLRAFGGGVAGPSANRFGRLSPTSAVHVHADLGDDVDLVLDGGECTVGVESTIVAFQDGQSVILRPGMITAEQIEAVIQQETPKKPENTQHASTVSKAPGTLASHYAPLTPVELVASEHIEAMVQSYLMKQMRLGILGLQEVPASFINYVQVVWHRMENQPDAYAQQLYAQLRLFDGLRLNRILVEQPPEEGHWAAITDRLKRAAY